MIEAKKGNQCYNIPHYGKKQAEKDRKRFLKAQEKANALHNQSE